MRDLIKNSLNTLRKSDEYICVTNEGDQISLEEATKQNIAVTILHPQQIVKTKLEEAGLYLTDTKFVNDLNELIDELNGTAKTGKKPVSGKKLSPAEKQRIIEGWADAHEDGMNKAQYARKVGVTYQSFINWIK
ncbi:hypothetical protein [Anditalea andensis]|uniref:Uncharacterized protein n=1 Tax=Anditalea andensis TaxID=1048983 RepID=A0A074L4Z4_9BACT|nr:hypothetical protein [Anditalea andensis]KEO75545.1 hypothetical protein EL17_00175 [Anditalea andensis]